MIDAAGRHPRLLFGALSTGLLSAALLVHLMVAPYLIPLYDSLRLPLPAATLKLLALGTPGVALAAALFAVGIIVATRVKEGRLFPLVPYLIFGLGILFFLACFLSLVLPFCTVYGH